MMTENSILLKSLNIPLNPVHWVFFDNDNIFVVPQVYLNFLKSFGKAYDYILEFFE